MIDDGVVSFTYTVAPGRLRSGRCHGDVEPLSQEPKEVALEPPVAIAKHNTTSVC